MARKWRHTIVPLTRKSLDAIWETACAADVIVYHPKTAGAADVGEATGAALFDAAPFPIFPTKAFPLFVFPGSYGPWLNRLTYKALLFSRLLLLPTVSRWRRDALGLVKASLFGTAGTGKDRQPGQLCAVSLTGVPGYPADDSEDIQTIGYWFLDEDQDWRADPSTMSLIETTPWSCSASSTTARRRILNCSMTARAVLRSSVGRQVYLAQVIASATEICSGCVPRGTVAI